MKRIKHLIYTVLQWKLKEVLILGFLMGGVATALLPDQWFILIPAALIGSFIESMFTTYRREKTLKK